MVAHHHQPGRGDHSGHLRLSVSAHLPGLRTTVDRTRGAASDAAAWSHARGDNRYRRLLSYPVWHPEESVARTRGGDQIIPAATPRLCQPTRREEARLDGFGTRGHAR